MNIVEFYNPLYTPPDLKYIAHILFFLIISVLFFIIF